MFGVLFIVPFYLEATRGISTAGAGLLLTALPISLGLVAPFAGKLADRIGSRPVATEGMLMTVIGLGALANFRHPETD